ncbi:MAG TPA: RNA polymerase sigma factor [Solirubrobacteraceae bacterium]|nr:RNA polymerase sigma factor [Solirubrobacteraceae bacterium]
MPAMTPHGSAWPGERVVLAAQQGDRRAVALLLSGSRPHVQRFARTLCSTPEEAEDAAQEALIVLYRKIGTLRASAALASWMFKVVLRMCLKHARELRPLRTAKAGSEVSAEDAALARLELDRIVSAIVALAPEQRAVLVLRDVHGLSGAAAAQELGLSRAAMKSRLHRAREALRIELEHTGERELQPTSVGPRAQPTDEA